MAYMIRVSQKTTHIIDDVGNSTMRAQKPNTRAITVTGHFDFYKEPDFVVPFSRNVGLFWIGHVHQLQIASSLSSSQCLIHDQKILILSDDTNDHHITHKYGENSLAVIVPVVSICHYLYTWFLAGSWLATEHFLVIPCGPKTRHCGIKSQTLYVFGWWIKRVLQAGIGTK